MNVNLPDGPKYDRKAVPVYPARMDWLIRLFLPKTYKRMNLIEELTWRGMVQDIMPGTAEQLTTEMTTGYIGFDPTADSLHIGSLVPILLLVHLQRAGHKPVALVGGATGMVGDPSGKSEERNLLSEEVLSRNVAGVKAQLEKYLDFDAAKPNSALLVNNYDWFKNFSFLDFIRDVGKHITINYMTAKDSVKKRLNSEVGMSFTEFTYQLVQGYDFYWLHQHHNAKLQMGGSDQWGNIVTGTELIRRKAGGEAYAFTCPLITKADGGKFGKTEQGNIWLDAAKTSPYEFYQFWLRASDSDAEKWMKIFTLLHKDIIDELIELHQQNPQDRLLQKSLAQQVTTFVHGEAGYQHAMDTTARLFSQQHAAAKDMSVEDLESIEGISRFTVAADKFKTGIDVITLTADTGIFPSRSEAKKLIMGGGLSINRSKVTDVYASVNESQLLHGKYLLVQKGKKNYYLLVAS